MRLDGFDSIADCFSRLPILAALGVFIASAQARADSLICQSVDQNTQIEVIYDGLDQPCRGPQAERLKAFSGERHCELDVREMILRDPTVQRDRQHIATFTSADGVLTMKDGLLMAIVDTTNPNSSRRGERVGGTLLGALSEIRLQIDFTYQETVLNGTRVAAEAIYVKKNGRALTQEFDCFRLPNEIPSLLP